MDGWSRGEYPARGLDRFVSGQGVCIEEGIGEDATYGCEVAVVAGGGPEGKGSRANGTDDAAKK